MLLIGFAGILTELAVGDEKRVAGKQHVGVLALLLQSGIIGIVPDGVVVGDPERVRDFGKVVSLSYDVAACHASKQSLPRLHLGDGGSQQPCTSFSFFCILASVIPVSRPGSPFSSPSC